MNKLKLTIVLLFFLPNFIFSQNSTDFTKVKTNSGEVKVPGKWEKMNSINDSGQQFLTNKDDVIIAIAENPKKAYPFFKSNASDFENVKLFYTWDSDYYKENNLKQKRLKKMPN